MRVRRGVRSAKDQGRLRSSDGAWGRRLQSLRPFGGVPLGSGSGEQRSIPTFAPGHWEQDPRIPLMAKPEKPNNGFSIGTPQVRAQGFRGPGQEIVYFTCTKP